MVLAFVVEWTLTHDEFLLASTVALNKVESFNNKAHTFLFERIYAQLF